MMRYRTGIDTLKPYDFTEKTWPIKLDANERPQDMPPRVQASFRERLAKLPLNRYPEIAAVTLRAKLADRAGCTLEQVQVGNGSSELLQTLCYVFGGQGRKIVYPDPSFSMYSTYIQLADSQPAPVKLARDYSLPVKDFVDQAKQANLAILCNPNNPTGNAISLDTIAKIASELTCPLIIDEAYFEFCQLSALDLMKAYSNLIIVRTFSKAYGLAGARVGYLLAAEPVSAAIGKVLLPYHVNVLSLTAAETVLDCQEDFLPGVEQLIAERERVRAALRDVSGTVVYPSQTNFLLVKSAAAAALGEELAANGIGIRNFNRSANLADCLRITIGLPAENDLVIAMFRNFAARGDKNA